MKQSIPPGYKKTEIGTIPEDWKVKRLGEVFEIISGPFGSSVKKEFFSKSGMPIYSAQNVINNNFKEVNYIDAEYYPKLKQFSVKENDLLITTRGTIGIIKRVPLNVSHGIIHSNLTILRKRQSISTKFIECLLNSYLLKKQLKTILSQTTIDALYANNISKFYIPLPPLSEQRAIARVLSDIDRLIESLDKLIEKKKLIKKGAMQELLTGKKRLPGFKGEWVRRKLGEIGTTYGGLTGKKKEDFGTGNSYYIPFLNVLMNIKIDTKNLEKVYIKENETQNKVRKGDLFFNTSSETPEEVGMCAVLTEDLEDTYLNSFCFGYRLKDESIDGLFLSYFINSEYGRKIFASIAQGATRHNLSKQHFYNIEIPFPPTLEEQQAIAQILSDMDAEIEALEQKKKKYEKIKKGAMELLLTGKIRLKDHIKEVLA